MTMLGEIEALKRTILDERRAHEETTVSLDAIRSQVATLTTERDEMVSRANDLGLAVAEERSNTDTLRVRVAELESNLEAASEQGREWLRERDTARDAALEEAKERLYLASQYMRHEALDTEAGPLRETRLALANDRLDMAGVMWALKAQPARRFVDAEKVERLHGALSSLRSAAEPTREMLRVRVISKGPGYKPYVLIQDALERACKEADAMLSEVKP